MNVYISLWLEKLKLVLKGKPYEVDKKRYVFRNKLIFWLNYEIKTDDVYKQNCKFHRVCLCERGGGLWRRRVIHFPRSYPFWDVEPVICMLGPCIDISCFCCCNQIQMQPYVRIVVCVDRFLKFDFQARFLVVFHV